MTTAPPPRVEIRRPAWAALVCTAFVAIALASCRSQNQTSSPESQPAADSPPAASLLIDEMSSPTTLGLNRVRFLDAETGWIAGRGGVVLSTTDGGVKWIPQASGLSENLIDVDFADRLNGWAISSHVLIHTTDGGKSWNQVWDTSTIEGITGKPDPDLPYEAILLRISFSTKTRGWALGLGWDPLTLRYRIPIALSTRDGGSSWQWQTLDDEFAAIAAVDDRTCVIAGKFGKIAETNDGGQTWLMRNSLAEDDFLAIEFSDSRHGWAVGAQGSMVGTRDGGQTWRVIYSSRNAERPLELRAVRFATDLVGVAAGLENRGTSDRPQYLLIALSTYDGGQSWSKKELTPLSFVPGAITLVAQDAGFVVGSGGQIIRFRVPA